MKKLIAEFIGTFALVFAGTGAIIVNDVKGGVISHLGIALTFGLVVMVMIYTLGDVSGAHLNPAVTFGFWIAGRLRGIAVFPYMLSQLAGAIAASVLLHFLIPQHLSLGATLPLIGIPQAFCLESILTFFLMFVILNVSTGVQEKGLMAGVAVGSTIALNALFAGPLTGASMNPARSLAPALVSGNVGGLWIYVLAPFIGAYLAILGCRGVRGNDCCSVNGVCS